MPEQPGTLVPTTYMVSCRACAPMMMYADKAGWDSTEWFDGVGYDDRWVRDQGNSITWTAFVRLTENFEEKIGGPDQLWELRELMVPS